MFSRDQCPPWDNSVDRDAGAPRTGDSGCGLAAWCRKIRLRWPARMSWNDGQFPCFLSSLDQRAGPPPTDSTRTAGPPRTVGLEGRADEACSGKGPTTDRRTVLHESSAPDRLATCWTDGTQSYLQSRHGPLCCYGPLSLRKDRGTCPDPHPR